MAARLADSKHFLVLLIILDSGQIGTALPFSGAPPGPAILCY